MLINQWRTRKKETGIYLILMSGIYLLGLLLFGAVSSDGNDTESIVPLGTILSLSIICIIHLIGCSMTMIGGFNLAVSMGITRRKYVLGFGLFSALELLGFCLTAMVFFFIEKAICTSGIYGTSAQMQAENFILEGSKYLPLGIAGILALELLTTALYLRFGGKVFAAIWLLVIAGPLLARWMDGLGLLDKMTVDLVNNIAGFYAGIGTPAVWLLTVPAEALLAAAAWNMLRRQQVVNL